jgi:CRP-like cAMP-binding protein
MNRLLAALPRADYTRLAPELTAMAARPRQVLQAAGEPIRHVYFPNSGVFSVTTTLPDGTIVETATVGDEGMFAVEAFFHGAAVSPGQALMQVPEGETTSMGFRAFRREIDARGALHDLVGRYAEAAVAQMMQCVACNALHNVQERCARWLLMTHDRVGQSEFQLSSESLAMMLGIRRPTVAIVARLLQQAGLITYRAGRVTVCDRSGLEAAACQCYPVLRSQLERLRS